jgi:hypothetical protein
MSESTHKTHATGRIEADTFEANTYDGLAGGPDLVEIQVTELFSGDVNGHGSARYLQALREDSSGSFVGIERVKGRIGDRNGSFLLQATGTQQGKTLHGQWFVVPGSGTSDLAGLRGEGGFTADLGQGASMALDYWFE